MIEKKPRGRPKKIVDDPDAPKQKVSLKHPEHVEPVPPKGRQSRTLRTEAEKIELVKTILEHYETGKYTISSCAETNGICSKTLYNWAENNTVIADLIKKAKDTVFKIGRENLKERGIDALNRLVHGFWIEETETEKIFDKNDNCIRRIERTKRKYYAPHTTAVIYALKVSDPQNWNESLNFETAGEDQVFKIGDQIIKFK
jgi:hypothetical protein